MSDDATTPDALDEEDGEAEAPPKKKGLSGKKLVLFIILPVVVLLGGGAGIYFSGILGGSSPAVEGEGAEQVPIANTVFYDLPDLLVNLRTGQHGQSFLRLSVSLEVSGPDGVSRIEQIEPRIVDSFQVYLRELRVDDLSGSAGLQRLREELLLRVNAAAQSHIVKDVLFKEMLIQ